MADTSLIKEHMDVISSDRKTVGKVDHLEGTDKIKLTKQSSPDGEHHHFIPLSWVDHVDQRVVDVLGAEEVSIGDFVLSGGEPAALSVVDAVVRLLPGALGDHESASSDSPSNSGPSFQIFKVSALKR